MRLRRRPLRRAGDDAVGLHAHAGAVAVEVVARCRREAQQQLVGRVDDGLDLEGLGLRQRQADGAGGRLVAAKQVDAAGRGQQGRASRGRQRHAQGLGVRRVADADVGAALVLHLQLHRRHAVGDGAGEHRGHLIAVGLDVAEELVGVGDAVGQLERIGAEAGRGHLGAHAVPVEVVALGDAPVQFDAAALGGLGAEREGLVDGQQVGLVQSLGRGGEEEQGQQGREPTGHAGSRVRGGPAPGRLPKTASIPGSSAPARGRGRNDQARAVMASTKSTSGCCSGLGSERKATSKRSSSPHWA